MKEVNFYMGKDWREGLEDPLTLVFRGLCLAADHFRKVKGYKVDLSSDLALLRQEFTGNKYEDSPFPFLYVLRDYGTHLFPLYRGSEDYKESVFQWGNAVVNSTESDSHIYLYWDPTAETLYRVSRSKFSEILATNLEG